MSIIKKYSALIIPLSIFWISVITVYFISTSRTGGVFFYTLDDAYIHMAMAKNFSLYGVWGITKYGFTSCSSSPLWTLMLSLFYAVFGIKDIFPFILNILFSSLTAYFVFLFTKKFTDNLITQAAVLLFILFYTPLVSVMFTGLEHSMQSFFIVLCCYYLYEFLSGSNRKAAGIMLPVSVMLLTASRYEGMFAAAGIFLVLVLKKKYLAGIMVVLFSFFPVLIFGVISVSKGWYFFPNSVLLKSSTGAGDAGLNAIGFINPQFFQLLWAYKRIMILLLVSGIMYFVLKSEEDSQVLRAMTIVFFIATVLHINFAKLGSLLRYEMYIMTFGILLNSILVIKFLKNKNKAAKISVYAFVIGIALLFSFSTYKAVSDVPVASANIYQMQYQMSRFINKYYKDGYIALNDIGAVNYYCDIHCIDMWGLADREAAELRRKGKYNTEEINRINRERKTEIAIIFDTWFEKYGGMPNNFYKSGTWRIPENITCGSDAVTFYATDSISFKKLDKNLWEFNSELNEKVMRNGEFIDRHTGF